VHEIGARDKFSEPLLQSIRELEGRVSAELSGVWVRSRRQFSDELNQTMRRLRQCASTEEVATWLVDSSTQFCGRAALFEVLGPEVRGVRARGFDLRSDGPFEQVNAPLELAPALAQAARECDTVVAIGSESEVSSPILEALGQTGAEKVYLFPVVIQERTVAILYAMAAVGQEADTAALELLTSWAASAAQLLAPEERSTAQPAAHHQGVPDRAPAGLVAITGVDMRAHAGFPVRDMKQESLEARARWFARVEVARMRLFHREALERGRAERNIYRALREQIDAARLSYRQDFVAVSAQIADYLDKELIGLANDDANLLGPEYPGSLV
jgi:hypothetical protein